MTLDEAIQYAKDLGTEEENKIDYDKDSPHMIICRKNTVKDYRQLAEWLTDYKELKNSIGAVKLKDMKDAVGLLEELNTENNQLTSQLAEAKRLLKAAVDDIQDILCQVDSVTVCTYCIHTSDICYGGSDCEHEAKWAHLEEAMKLIGEDGDTP